MFLQVTEQITALADEFQQAAAGRMVLLVAAEMFRQISDAVGEQRDLYFRRTRIVFIGTKFSYDCFFFLLRLTLYLSSMCKKLRLFAKC